MKTIMNLPNRFSKLWLNICKGLLSLLGVSAMASCSEFPFGEVKCEYGSPYASYEIKGKVVDSTNTPVPGIVIAPAPYEHYINNPHYSTSTKADGTFHFKLEYGPYNMDKVYAVDVDGTANGGLFETKEQKLDILKVSEGDGGWHTGKYTAKEVTITLVPQQKDYQE